MKIPFLRRGSKTPEKIEKRIENIKDEICDSCLEASFSAEEHLGCYGLKNRVRELKDLKEDLQ